MSESALNIPGLSTLSNDIATPGAATNDGWSGVVDDLLKVGGTLGALVLSDNLKNTSSHPPTVKQTQPGGSGAAQAPASKFPWAAVGITAGAAFAVAAFVFAVRR